ncbi:MAG TPA: hypothetical protein VIV60_12675 [Polyangiaceae bacterium]
MKARGMRCAAPGAVAQGLSNLGKSRYCHGPRPNRRGFDGPACAGEALPAIERGRLEPVLPELVGIDGVVPARAIRNGNTRAAAPMIHGLVAALLAVCLGGCAVHAGAGQYGRLDYLSIRNDWPSEQHGPRGKVSSGPARSPSHWAPLAREGQQVGGPRAPQDAEHDRQFEQPRRPAAPRRSREP